MDACGSAPRLRHPRSSDFSALSTRIAGGPSLSEACEQDGQPPLFRVDIVAPDTYMLPRWKSTRPVCSASSWARVFFGGDDLFV